MQLQKNSWIKEFRMFGVDTPLHTLDWLHTVYRCLTVNTNKPFTSYLSAPVNKCKQPRAASAAALVRLM